MYKSISEIQSRTPSIANNSDVFNRSWASKSLELLAKEIISQSRDDTKLSAILDEVSYVVFNYSSVIHQGMRWTFTLASDNNFVMPAVQQVKIPDQTEHRMMFYNSVSAENSKKRFAASSAKRKHSDWISNWVEYLSGKAVARELTLNELLLQTSVQPKPFAISWDENFQVLKSSIDKSRNEFDADPYIDAPLLLQITNETKEILKNESSIKRHHLEPGDANKVDEISVRFWNSYIRSGEFRTWILERMSSEKDAFLKLTAHLIKHFGVGKSGSFVSIPSFISTKHHPFKRLDGSSASALRSVVSFSLRSSEHSDRCKRELESVHRNAYDFFSILANEIMKDLMVHEYAHFLKLHSEKTTLRLLDGAAHPIKSRLIRAKRFTDKNVENVEGSNKIIEDLIKDLSGLKPVIQEPELDSLVQKANHLKSKINEAISSSTQVKDDVHAAARRLYLIHFRGKLLKYSDALSEIRTVAKRNAKSGKRVFPIKQLLETSASETLDKKGYGVRVNPIFLGNLDRISLPYCMTSGPLVEFREDEELMVQGVFDELFENAATYGASYLSEDKGSRIVDVKVEVGSTDENKILVTFGNLADLGRKSVRADYTASHDDEEPTKIEPVDSSGLSLAAEILEVLQIAELHKGWGESNTGEPTFEITMSFNFAREVEN